LQSVRFSSSKNETVKAWYRSENINFLIRSDPNSRDISALADIRDRLQKNPTASNAFKVPDDRKKIRDTQTTENADLYDLRAATSGLVDRPLVQEVARVEATLTRMNYHLRVTVIRYFKSLLIFIWTAIILSICVSFLNIPNPATPEQIAQIMDSQARAALQHSLDRALHVKILVCYGFGLLWATGTPIITSLPILWIQQAGSAGADVNTFRIDSHLVGFENLIYYSCLIAVLLASLGAWYIEDTDQAAIGFSYHEQYASAMVIVISCLVTATYKWISSKIRWRP
jgi:hypothetical protein